MEAKTSDNSDSTQNNNKNVLRAIFLNIFICTFIIMSYFYLSEFFGSVSTIYVENSALLFNFGVVLFIFTIFSFLAGKYHGFITGFCGELLYQLAYYELIYFDWCLIVGLWGSLCGLYPYKPLKYKNRMNIIKTIILLFVVTLFTTLLVQSIAKNQGLIFFLQSLITVMVLVPLILFIYDKFLATKERHFYHITLTHHPFSMSDHTFYLKFGRTYVYFCSRCSGVIIGGMYSFFFTHLFEKIYQVELSAEIAVLLCIILPIPGLIDWGTQRMLLRKATTETRLFTGFIIGAAVHLLSFTQKYYLFMMFLVIFYFSILFILMYFGHRKETRLIEKQNNML